MMRKIRIGEVTPLRLAMFDAALRQLSQELGDPHRAGIDALNAALFGPGKACAGLLAIDEAVETPHEDAMLGAALFSPVFSTATGGTGIYVSDLWVAPEMRGGGLGKRLLATVIRAGRRNWNACFLRLATHDHNPRALAFYRRLGFSDKQGETQLLLAGSDLERLAEI